MKTIDKILLVYSDNIPRLIALARSIVCDASEAEDVMQDVLLRLLSNPKSCDKVKNPLAFLRTCIRNEAIDHVRKLGRSVPTQDEILNNMRGYASDSEMKHIEDLMWIRSYVDSLPQDMQKAFIAYAVDGYSIAEVSKQMGIPQDTLRKRFDLIKQKMRGDRGSAMLFLLLFKYIFLFSVSGSSN